MDGQMDGRMGGQMCELDGSFDTLIVSFRIFIYNILCHMCTHWGFQEHRPPAYH